MTNESDGWEGYPKHLYMRPAPTLLSTLAGLILPGFCLQRRGRHTWGQWHYVVPSFSDMMSNEAVHTRHCGACGRQEYKHTK